MGARDRRADPGPAQGAGRGDARTLQGDEQILELLRASIESNLETLETSCVTTSRSTQVPHQRPPRSTPAGWRSAGISSIALVRASGSASSWCWSGPSRNSPAGADPQVAFAAARTITDLTFGYVDSISEQVVVAYETERERWLANRNTVRAAMLRELLGGEPVDVAAAERPSATACGSTTWASCCGIGRRDETLRQLERLLHNSAGAGCNRPAAVLPARPVHRRGAGCRWAGKPRHGASGGGERCSTGRTRSPGGRLPRGRPTGFRVTHLEAGRAQQVALAARERVRLITAYTDPEVRAAAMLASDLEGTRRLVAKHPGSAGSRHGGRRRGCGRRSWSSSPRRAATSRRPSGSISTRTP